MLIFLKNAIALPFMKTIFHLLQNFSFCMLAKWDLQKKFTLSEFETRNSVLLFRPYLSCYKHNVSDNEYFN